MNRKKFFISLALAMFAMAGNAAASQTDPQADGNLPALRVEGKNLVDANGKTVVLHGVMDTPNRYFNGWRWQQWKADYSKPTSSLAWNISPSSLLPSPTRSRVLTAPCSVCTWILAGPTIHRRRQRTRPISRRSTWRATAYISRNFISH